MKTVVFFLSLLFTLTAAAEPTRTVSWYRAHPTERAALLAKCRNNPGDLAATPNCQNAEKADAIEETARTGRLQWRPLTKQELPPPWETGPR